MNIGNIINNAVNSIKLRDTDGIIYEISSEVKNGFIEFTQDIIKNEDGITELRLNVRNVSDETLFIDEVAVIDISDKKQGILALGGNINSWTMLTGGFGKGVEDLCDPCHNEGKLDYYSPYYSVIGNRKTGKYVFAGFLTFRKQDAEIKLKAVEGFKFESLKAVCYFSELPLKAGEELQTETLYVNTADTPSAALEKYFDLVMSEVDKSKINFRDIIGWATWDYYQAAITEDDILKNMDWLCKNRNSIPVEYIQLDHGFQNCEGDWLDTNKKFPHGLKWLSAKVKENGFNPGLWLCPFLVAPQCKVYKEHPDWVIKTANGNPLEVNGYAVRTVYALDCSISAACNWIRELARTVTVDYGYEYIKLDGANGQGMSPLGVLANPEISKGEAMLNGLTAFKDGMKDGSFLLGCWFSALGIQDGMRVGEDVGGRWDSSKIAKHHGERDSFNGPGEVLRAIAATMNHYHQHKKLWVNDSDYMVVRQKGSNSELSYEEAQSWASIVSMSNGLVMLSDNMPELETERITLLEKVLPHYKHAAKPIDFFRKNVPSLYDLKVKNKTEEWHVVCITNVDYPAREREYTLNFKEIGFNADKEYHIFDFWKNIYQGIFSGSYSVKLQPHCCQVIAIRENLKVPQILSTDIHISQGGLEIESCKFVNNTLNIKTTNMKRSGNVFVFVPNGYMSPKKFINHSENVWKCKLKIEGKNESYAFNGI